MNTARRIVRRCDSGPVEFPGLHPVLARVFRARQVSSAGELDHSLEHLLPPGGLLGIDGAAALLEKHLRNGSRILIVADYDADGATACAVLMRALRAFGARNVQYLVPNRFEYGYGLTPEIVALGAQRESALIVTVDNGISSIAGVRAARESGMEVLITDHHLPGETLPFADAIVNPNQPGDSFGSKVIAGVGVAFYVMLQLRARLRVNGWFEEQDLAEPNLARLLDLVALGTVADVVPLDRNNRILVAQGLMRLNTGSGCAGIRALLEVGGRRAGQLTAADLGFVVGPRLNAAGRLEDMSLGIECLLTDDDTAAMEMARALDRLNRERRSIESSMQQQALEAVETAHVNEQDVPSGLCLFDETWHQGVIGLVASRLKERFQRPVIAFAPGSEPDELKGSARSVPELHIRDCLDTIAARHPGLLVKFGGHAMAAGLSLRRVDLDRFRAAFAEEVENQRREDSVPGALFTDGELGMADFTLDLAQALRRAGPWGQGFPEPLFDGVFTVIAQRTVGERHLKFSLRTEDDGRTLEAIAFNAGERGPALTGTRVRAAYRLDVNEYRGTRSLQLVIEHFTSEFAVDVRITG